MTKLTYQQLSSELEQVVADLQREDTNVDEALTQYKRGLELIALLEKQLKGAENTVIELKAKFSAVAE